MKRKRTFVLAVAGAVLLAFICFTWWQSRQSYSRWAGAYARVELGMTRTEVTEAIGLPPGYHEGEVPMPLSMARLVRTPPLDQAGVAYDDLARTERRKMDVWVGRDYVIWVLFDEDGAAVGRYLLELYPGGFRSSAFMQRCKHSQFLFHNTTAGTTSSVVTVTGWISNR